MVRESKSNTLVVSLLSSLVSVTACYLVYLSTRTNETQKERQKARRITSEGDDSSSLIKPPFPQVLVDMLNSSHLAYLSTVDIEDASSHLSLMRYTYLQEEQLLVLSTNRKTKKYQMLTQQRGVSLLVHDFDNTMDSSGAYSITLNGTCRIVRDEEAVERYRAAHLKHNPEYPQFIVGPDIAILCIDVTSARICNINDQVIKWNVTESFTNDTPNNKTVDGSTSQ